jgi:hypothetical protein
MYQTNQQSVTCDVVTCNQRRATFPGHVRHFLRKDWLNKSEDWHAKASRPTPGMRSAWFGEAKRRFRFNAAIVMLSRVSVGGIAQEEGLPIFYSPATRLGAEGGFRRFAFVALVFAAACVILAAAAMVAFNVI